MKKIVAAAFARLWKRMDAAGIPLPDGSFEKSVAKAHAEKAFASGFRLGRETRRRRLTTQQTATRLYKLPNHGKEKDHD